MFEHIVKTSSSDEMINITSLVRQDVQKSGITSGIAVVFVPHTTAGVTINENADPDVVYDLLDIFRRAFPERGSYRHMEGNSHAHAKASVTGSSCTVIIENGQLKLGTWQGIYFCEFDGPRTRKVYVKLIEG
ncbi:MAG: secondary thiamine-phosphate synthase enzyme YjbQ [Acetivibrionales bacterium]|jgi:secondary thiamine-phosphate synthase enzyme|nr:secondary thiamine-phosphate synthase enzyme YjbQ [Bacillota bacterium]HOA54311.1 secondary thiamine-phosphate synthase enzyme YjbQ [Clostridiales bacterium]HPZ06079.1 secondary thiamine-phosphate synthase enzyme YjbQ [Clostridiales bacterium]HQD31357.1 secondary thiamine-phosphate synthase enzyme YjbQ [Clostridiales bacterium]